MSIDFSWIGGGLILVVLVVVFLANAIRIFREYERGVVFTLGRFWQVKGPGLVIVIPIIQQAVRVDLRTVVLEVPTQDVISRDNVSVKVSAVVYLRVVDPQKAIIQVADYLNATSRTRPDHAALRARQTPARRYARRAGEAEHGHPAGARCAD